MSDKVGGTQTSVPVEKSVAAVRGESRFIWHAKGARERILYR